MQRKRVGFAGCYSHDIILILAKVLSCVGKKVLILDWNEQHTLGASVPMPEELSAENEIVEYDGVFFTEQITDEETEASYDAVLIDFGMTGRKKEMGCCTELILVTDMLPHHIRRLSGAELPGELVKECIIRDAVEGHIAGKKELKEFFEAFPNRREFFVPPDRRDVENRCVCETLYEYNINRASSELQGVIYSIAGLLYPEFSEREFRKRLRHRERRRYH